MKIEITARGVYGAKGEIPVGTTIDMKNEPKGWAGRYRVVSGGGQGKTAVTNPAANPVQQMAGYAVADKGRGWFVITKDGQEVTKSLRADDVEGFDALSDDDKGAFVELHKAD